MYRVLRSVDGVLITNETHKTLELAQASFSEWLDHMAYGWLGIYKQGKSSLRLVEGWGGDEPKTIKSEV